MIEKTVCFTGHRPQSLGGFHNNNPLITKIKYELKELILKAIKEGFLNFISGGALGVDQLAADIVLDLKKTYKIKLIIAKPFPSQSKVWPKESQSEFELICDQADNIVNVSEDPYSAWKLQKRNEYMIDNSSLVIAVWNGSSGGTANAIAYANKKNKLIKRINPKNL